MIRRLAANVGVESGTYDEFYWALREAEMAIQRWEQMKRSHGMPYEVVKPGEDAVRELTMTSIAAKSEDRPAQLARNHKRLLQLINKTSILRNIMMTVDFHSLNKATEETAVSVRAISSVMPVLKANQKDSRDVYAMSVALQQLKSIGKFVGCNVDIKDAPRSRWTFSLTINGRNNWQRFTSNGAFHQVVQQAVFYLVEPNFREAHLIGLDDDYLMPSILTLGSSEK